MSMFELQNLIKHIIVTDGDRVVFNFDDVDIKDNILELNKNETHDLSTGSAGININRFGSDSVSILWEESEQAFTFRKNGSLVDIQFNSNTGSTEPTSGWKDLISPLSASNSGDTTKAPIWADPGNGIWCWHFADERDQEMYVDFHIMHDIKPGSKIYPHIHWMPLSYSTGLAKWKIEYVHAKGHQQNESLTGAVSSMIVEASGKGLIGEHMVTECSDLQAFVAPEVDSIIRFKITRLGADAGDTFYGSVGGLMADIHYESDRDHTINKAPDFYV
jgi:hypothetical protein